jgi:L-ribulose-5-phosphate 4-epimerase
MRLEHLRSVVCAANRRLVDHGLVTLTWGNVSGIDREEGIVAIKPSGVDYERLTPKHIVLVDLEGRVVEGELRPSSDTPTHIALYRAFGAIGGITHTHSVHATAFAQARVPLPCFGTTHADHFMGEVPVTRQLTPDEVEAGYEANTGAVIIERFARADDRIDPAQTPAVLVAGHAPFCFGRDAPESVKNAVALEACARMAILAREIRGPGAEPPPELEHHIRQKHFTRKHGPGAYYGQAVRGMAAASTLSEGSEHE